MTTNFMNVINHITNIVISIIVYIGIIGIMYYVMGQKRRCVPS